MEVIKPNEIGAKISTLIAESNKIFYAVTAFIDLSTWKKILINLEKAIKRGVVVKFYFREIKEADYKTLKKLGVEMYKINGLHTKLYLNEKEVIVSSMNLYEYSDLYSIDIALHFTNSEDYNKVYDYFLNYIKNDITQPTYVSKDSKVELRKLHEYLSERFKDFKITITSTYLFSTSLVPFFDLFIDDLGIKLKYSAKYATPEKISALSNFINSEIKNNITFKEPTDSYKHYIWDIELTDKSPLSYANLISILQQNKLSFQNDQT